MGPRQSYILYCPISPMLPIAHAVDWKHGQPWVPKHTAQGLEYQTAFPCPQVRVVLAECEMAIARGDVEGVLQRLQVRPEQRLRAPPTAHGPKRLTRLIPHECAAIASMHAVRAGGVSALRACLDGAGGRPPAAPAGQGCLCEVLPGPGGEGDAPGMRCLCTSEWLCLLGLERDAMCSSLHACQEMRWHAFVRRRMLESLIHMHLLATYPQDKSPDFDNYCLLGDAFLAIQVQAAQLQLPCTKLCCLAADVHSINLCLSPAIS